MKPTQPVSSSGGGFVGGSVLETVGGSYSVSNLFSGENLVNEGD